MMSGSLVCCDNDGRRTARQGGEENLSFGWLALVGAGFLCLQACRPLAVRFSLFFFLKYGIL
jgi:hypothetical protein